MVLHGFYILNDDFLELANDPYLKNNKESNRPLYYCIKDLTFTKELYWMIPLSSSVSKYQQIIDKKAKKVSPSSLMVVQSTTITILWAVNIRAMKAEDRNRKWWNASEDERRICAS